jgi:ABC-type uncharacterized transport system permease subunit
VKNNNTNLSTSKTGALAGLLSIRCYFGAAALPLPHGIGNLMGFGYAGIVIASLLLFLNLYTFPHGPNEAGRFDAGPFL